jgi:hypothetical protein
MHSLQSQGEISFGGGAVTPHVTKTLIKVTSK